MRMSYITRKLTMYAAVAIIFLGIGALAQQITIPAGTTIRRLPIYSVQTQQKKVALTFDVAWENSDTEELLAVLEPYGVKATFFVTGDFCDRCGEDVKQFAQAGHDVGNHSDMHPHPNQLKKVDLLSDTKACNRKIKELIGTQPTLYRAPYGEYNSEVIAAVEDSLNMKVIQWDVDSMDWKRNGVEAAVQNVLSKVQSGSIILFHNDLETTVPAVEKVIRRLQGQGYEFVLVKDMIYQTDYTIDATGRQRPN